MFVITRGKPMAKTKRSAVTQKPKELPPVQTVSDLVLGSCYIASLAIAILASLEAFKQFQVFCFQSLLPCGIAAIKSCCGTTNTNKQHQMSGMRWGLNYKFALETLLTRFLLMLWLNFW
jgi:hypothetical protein